jgi:hypothetical protein
MSEPGNRAGTGRDANGRMVPGTTLNPSGRPKVVEEFRARARKAVDEKIVARWIREVEDDGPDWVKCSELLAAYGYGKPSQSVELNADVTASNPHSQLTIEELRALARHQLEEESAKNNVEGD